MSAISTRTRFLFRFVRMLTAALKRMPGLRDVDLAAALTGNTEAILNLPVQSSFFPTAAVNTDQVETLLRKLHPVSCDQNLIRLGPESDGGYLVPDDVEGIEACFSPGVSDIAGFERDCASLGMQVYMADGSVDSPPEFNPRFNFIKKFIGASTHGDSISLEDWVGDSATSSGADLLLQMDIEGHEYETILSMPKDLQERFRIIVVEFHYLDYLFSEPLFAIYSKAFDKLLNTHYCVHIHPNNVAGSIKVGKLEVPQMAEFTFLRRDRVKNARFAAEFPHPLDRDNTEGESIVLPACCYGGSSSL